MNWRRCAYQIRSRRGGSVSLADEYEYRRNDHAARWLDARLNRKPRNTAATSNCAVIGYPAVGMMPTITGE